MKNFFVISNIAIQIIFLSNSAVGMYNSNNGGINEDQVYKTLQNVSQISEQVDHMLQEAKLHRGQGNFHPSFQAQIEQVELLRQEYELILQILQQSEQQQQLEQTHQQTQLSNNQQLLQMFQQSQQFSQQINNQLFQQSPGSNPYQLLSLIQQTHFQPLQSSSFPQSLNQIQQLNQPNQHQSMQNLQQSIRNVLQKLDQLKQEIQ